MVYAVGELLLGLMGFFFFFFVELTRLGIGKRVNFTIGLFSLTKILFGFL